MSNGKTAKTTVLADDLWDKIAADADRQHRSVNGQINMIIEQHYAEKEACKPESA